MLNNLKGKVAIITCAGRGIGRSIALALAEKAVKVVLISRTQLEIDAAAKEAEQFNAASLALKADVSQEAEVLRIVKKTLSVFKG